MIYKNFEQINENLLNLYRNQKLSHAIIISGRKGIGKYSFLLDFVKKSLNTKFDNHPNILIIDKDDKKEITINKIRKINEFVNCSAAANNDKFVIIDDACSMNKYSANALLKILEEPRLKNYIILICHNIDRIIPTVRSRCHIIKAKPLNFDSFANILKEKDDKNYNIQEVTFLYEICDGSISFAINNGSEIVELYKILLNSIISGVLNKDIIKISIDKSFDFDIFVKIAEFLCLRILKSYYISNLEILFNDNLLFEKIRSHNNFDKASLKINKSIFLLNQVQQLSLDKKTAVINFFNILNCD